MKKLFFLAACVSLMAASCTGNKNNNDNSAAAERDSLQRIIDNKDQELNEIMGTFNEIQDGFRRINEAEGRIAVADGNPESASNKEAIRENMEFNDIPESFRGMPIVLVSAGLMAIAFFGFSGVI